MSGAITPRIEALHSAFSNAVFKATLSTNVEQEMWEKWVMLATLGGTTCLMRGNIGQIVATAPGIAFLEGFLSEVVAAVTALGHAPGAAFLATLRRRLTEIGSPWTSSMYRDMERGNQVEAEQILGDLLVRAKGAGVAVPLLAAAYAGWSCTNRLEKAKLRTPEVPADSSLKLSASSSSSAEYARSSKLP